MKSYSLISLLPALFMVVFLFNNCSDTVSDAVTYDVTITPVERTNAPALQSFAHAADGADWLLFAGRTNSQDSLIGGLHSIAKGNYANTSFIPPSFNGNLLVYNVESDSIWSLPIGDFFSRLSENCTNCDTMVSNTRNVFVNTNPLVMQNDDFLYMVGGYGPEPGTSDSSYITYDAALKIHVPSMISLVKGNYSHVQWNNLIRFGNNETFRSTGGELFEINDTLYLAGGHNFGSKATGGQQYVSAVYPFTLTDSGYFGLQANIGEAISDKANPRDSAEANNSIFRRRDAPIVPALYKNGTTLEQGITFYTGVFRPGSPPLAWNDAIYVHPTFIKNNKYYTPDSSYDQGNHNVYATSHFEAYDSSTDTLHTFLLGGIGTGNVHGGDTLSGFTNNGVHITMDVSTLKSNYTLMENVFPSTHPDSLYGAESILFLSKNKLAFTTAGGEETEIIDLATTFANNGGSSVDVGYIYGGIETYEANPQTYGSGKSAASNKVWKVTLHKKSN